MIPTDRYERMIELGHPRGIAFSQVIVDGDEMGALPFQRIEIEREGGHQGFSFPGLHFGDSALVQNHAADQLHVEMPHIEPAGHLPAHREGFGQNVVERFRRRDASELLRFVGQGLIR